MSISNAPIRPSDQRPIPMRLRTDLVFEETVYQGERSWIVKDPVSMKYFRLRAAERMAIESIDGTTSYQEIHRQLQSEFPNDRIRIADLYWLVNSFHQGGLLISDAPGQAEPLMMRRQKEVQQKSLQLMMSALSLRFPGVDPERFLSWLYPKVRWLFSWTMFVLSLAICVAALALLLQNLDEFSRRLPEFEKFFDLNNLLFMAGILMVTKSLHELGHGLACKHYGGECHEIGFMLLVLTPAMYCNTSDSWILPNKWHRIAIGAAGMYVEIVLAAICAFVWWYTQPGVIHYMALNTIFLCSVSTIIFNANPLLRYDGYYMLSDFLEIPNLGTKSRMALISKVRVWCLGLKPVNPLLLPKQKQTAFAIYAVASFVYRWFIMLVIFWFLAKVFEPYGLEPIGYAMIAISIAGMIGFPFYRAIKFFRYPGRIREVNKLRFAISAALCLVGAYFVFAVPLPHNVHATFVVRPSEAQNVYVTQAGSIAEVNFEAGQSVRAGDVIVVLQNEDLEIEFERLKGELASAKAEVNGLRLDAQSGVEVSRDLVAAEVRVSEVSQRLEIQQRKVDALQLVALRDGTILPPPNELGAAKGSANQWTLTSWSGTPLEDENRGAFVEPQTLYCLVGNPDQLKAILVIDQASAKFVKQGQPVDLMFDERAGERTQGQIQFVSRQTMTNVPRELTLENGGTIATKNPPGGMQSDQKVAPLMPAYEASVLLANPSGQKLLPGSRGHAKIRVGSASLGQRMLRYLSTVINFR